MKPKILYVDDELENLQSFRLLFKKDFDVSICQNPIEALELLQEENFSVILSDSRMPTMSGIEFLTQVKDTFPDIPRILITGYTDYDSILLAINQAGISKCVQKPFEARELREILLSCCKTTTQINFCNLNLLDQIGVIVLDKEDNIKFVSLEIKNLIHQKYENLIGKNFYEIFSLVSKNNLSSNQNNQTLVYTLSNFNINFYFQMENYEYGIEDKKIFYGFCKK